MSRRSGALRSGDSQRYRYLQRPNPLRRRHRCGVGQWGAVLSGWVLHRASRRTLLSPAQRPMNAPILDSHGLFLLCSAAASVIGLILLIAVGKLNPFLSLMIVSLALAVTTGMSLEKIVASFETGTGNTLG